MPSEPILAIRGLSMSFGTRSVLNEIDLEVRSSEILGIMGSSGGGKSTVLKSIIGLIKPLRGEILFNDRDLAKLSESELTRIRPMIGFVFQDGALFDSLSVRDNLKYPLLKHTTLTDEQMDERINERLEMVGLEKSCQLFPNELSGGMQKRVGLIRATILDPSLVLFDEPTAGMDPMNIQTLIDKVQYFKKVRHNSGIFVSHDFSVVRSICDRVALLWEGGIRITATPSELEKSRDPIVQGFTQPKYQRETCGKAS
jgi:phospholipid/cholesterol/gamma-HCH transport system ATP-binding protein